MSEVVNSYHPTSFNEGNNKQEWRDARKIEYNALIKSKT
jgi:hypothetical protein